MSAQWDTHKNLMPLLCHAENNIWLSGPKASARKNGDDGKDLGHLTVLGCPACLLLPGWLPGSWQVSRSLYHRYGSGNTLLQGPTGCEQEVPDFPSPAPLSPPFTAGLVQFDVSVLLCFVTHGFYLPGC